ncbi:MAG: hypothetical protein ACOZIN_22270 [Myxococcota bacterium]
MSVQAGGGVEGYTGDLAPQIQPGFGYGAQVLFKPTPIVGIEVAYSGAVNEVDVGLEQELGATSGADLVRNGGSAAATIAFVNGPVQPYVLGGIGFSHYNARGDTENFGFQNDTGGNVPLGVGIRGYAGGFVADLRGQYSVLFDHEFAPNVEPVDVAGINSITAGRYSGTLNLGYIF